LNWEEEFPLLHADCSSPESLLIQKSNIAAMRDAIEQLPFSYREVILLCDVEGLTYREIAEILEIPIGTVMSRLARARKAVRDVLRPTQTEHYRQPNSALEEAGRHTSCARQKHLYV
jgi:RNA polymerase sigma factor (sigma-70 family)